MDFTIKETFNTSAESIYKAWESFAHNFDDAYKWMASVNHSR